ncbi:MAG: 3-dehydroquinate synthase [Lachnospiraceae bacterium]|nr:3-dehydroquinate synthase [Lachnospiraceae bacterium]
MNDLSVSYEGRPCYDIVFDNSFEILAQKLSDLGFLGRRVAVITDSKVSGLYLKELTDAVSSVSGNVFSYVFKAGEESKNLDTIADIYDFLIKNRFDRKDVLIALGGGVCGDMTGYAAATYLRGISFIQIPTTLLSQCDSSIGGKTGVDFKGYKNMVGAFYMPKLVLMNMKTLLTLDERQFAAGFAEVIKHGLIADSGYFDWLCGNRSEITGRNEGILSEMIRTSCGIKRDVVEKDPKESGLRMILNFGHTIGHAVEKYCDFNLLHGECVSLGMCAAAAISKERGMLKEEDVRRITDAFTAFKMPTRREGIDPKRIAELVKSDKKADNGRIRFILLDGIGSAEIVYDITDEEIIKGVEVIS